ncbi:nitroreductase family protein [Fusibacter ferrireducens]|uniref:Nitroreductase family protein n=1 Tax=Fusibacter ferrireducens TaxID=2785058 RepID=A0ABR9ZNW6_9FIRM|nr:nitroreductase family protein [Fusibacter ferrireducens]MBF4692155.1 nitroreductase family protein [Fusibacter ferrireducens]
MMDSQLAQPLDSQLFHDVVRGRHATRVYNSEIKVAKEEITEIIEQATLAPSGGNLQSWRFLVMDSPELKQKLLPIAYNQKQVVEASAVIVVLGDLECYTMADKIYGRAVDAGFLSEDMAKTFIKRYTDLYSNMSSEEIRQTICIDCGLASMQLMLTARSKGYDTGPMSGFDKEKFLEAFNISDRYFPVLLITFGKAKAPAYPTVRLPIQDVTFFNESLSE